MSPGRSASKAGGLAHLAAVGTLIAAAFLLARHARRTEAVGPALTPERIDLLAEWPRAGVSLPALSLRLGTDEARPVAPAPDPRRRRRAEGWLPVRTPAGEPAALAVGDAPALYLPVHAPAGARVFLDLARLPDVPAPQRVTVLGEGGDVLASFEISASDGFETVTFALPAGTRPGPRLVRLRFERTVEIRDPVTGAPMLSGGAAGRLRVEGGPGLASEIRPPQPTGGGLLLEPGTCFSVGGRFGRKAGLLRIEAEPAGAEPARLGLTLYDLEGETLWRTELDAGAPSLRRIELPGCPSGYGLLRVAAAPPGAVTVRTLRFRGGAAGSSSRVPDLPLAGRDAVLLVLDAASARHLEHPGAPPVAPHLEAIERDALGFERAVAPASYTVASIGSLFTALWPDHHGVIAGATAEGALELRRDRQTLAECLARAGYDTRAYVTNPNAGAAHGYARGFGTFVPLYEPRLGLWRPGVTPEDLAAAIERDLAERPLASPAFLYVHVFPPHAPWTPPERWLRGRLDPGYTGPADGGRASIDAWRRFERHDYAPRDFAAFHARYDASLAWADNGVRRILETIGRHLDLERALVVVTADHGEALGEHGTLEHGETTYGEQVEVPLFLRLPRDLRDSHGEAKRSRPVSLVDLAATLRSRLAGADPGDGEDLLAVTNAEAPPRPIFLRSSGFAPSFGVRLGRYALHADTYTGAVELYDLELDPREERPLTPDHPAREILYQVLCRHLCSARPADSSTAGASSADQLAEIGYVAQPSAGASRLCPLLRRAALK